MLRILVVMGLLVAPSVVPNQAAAQGGWFRGNVHVHTTRSDGGSPPDDVIGWYRNHGYQFVAITDHDVQTVTPGLASRFDAPGRFLVLPGVEVTDRVDGRPVHLNGLGVSRAVRPEGGRDVVEALQRDAAAIERAAGLPVLNHPNGVLPMALRAAEIAAGGVSHFEVCCADYRGGSGHPSTDEIWDAVLGSGRLLYGVAADDAHDFGPASRDPGSAWVMVRADSLTAPDLLRALRQGDFYATTGVVLDDVRVEGGRLCLRIGESAAYGFRTHFIGQGGVIIEADESLTPCHALAADGSYLRARVERSDGAVAWVQPVFRRRP